MRLSFLPLVFILLAGQAFCQVDTTLIYNENTPYGTLDIRLKRSETSYFYLKEGSTFSFRTENGQRTNSYLHLTAWDSEPYLQGQLREKYFEGDNFVMNYRMLLPEGYRPDVQYPVVLFLHGIQESGNCVDENCIHGSREYDPNTNSPPAPEDFDSRLYNNDYNLLHGGRNYLNARNRAGTRLVGDPQLHARGFPGIAVFPQSNNGWSPSEVENALRLLRLVVKKYNVDPTRIYINGLSRGGYGAFEALKRAPWMFAAGAFFSPVSDANINSLNLVPSVQHVPLWIFQGGQDLLPLPKETEDRIRRFREGGMSVRYTLYPHLGHATWNEALEEPDFFAWLLGYTNNRIHVFGGTESICASGSDGLKLFLPPGYAEYEWQLERSTIKTGPENFLSATQSGKYRARFRYTNSTTWNEWTREISIGISSPEQARFEQRGTFHLPDPNGKGEADVTAVGKFNYYRWFRNGSAINFEGDRDDTLKIATIPPSVGSGAITLKVADFGGCYSPESEPRNVFFDGQSPINLTSPTELAGESRGPSRIDLTWKDNATDEEGFEIWRKAVSPVGSAWVMAGLTEPNADSFTDTGLKPEHQYAYKIRAVSNNGRSDYLPSGGNTLTVDTQGDTSPPSPPHNVRAELVDVNTIRIQWTSADDDTSIKGYQLFVNDQVYELGPQDTIFVLPDLATNTTYTIQVAAIDAGDNIGPKSDPVDQSTEMTGFFYKHTTGAWNDLVSIDWSVVEYEGRVPEITLSPKRQEDFFNFRFDGFILIDKPGAYQFRISSDDGSRLHLNGTTIIDNDGIHDLLARTSPARDLDAGPQRIRIDFFDFMSTDSVVVEYMGPDTENEWRLIDRETVKSSPNAGKGKLDFVVFPNPVENGSATVAIRDSTGDPFQVRMTDSLGKIVREFYYNESGRSAVTFTDLFLPSGVYLVTVSQNGKVNSRRVVIH